MVGNPLIPISATSALPVKSFLRDTLSPSLTTYGLNLDSGVLIMTFSEPIDPATVLAGQIILQNTATLGSFVTLAASSASNSLSIGLNLTLNYATLNAIKSNIGLGRATSNTYLSASFGFVSDTSGNGVASISNASGLQASFVIPDTHGPVLTGFDYNAAVGTLVMRFSEVVNTSSLNVSRILLQASGGAGAVAVRLTGAQVQTAGASDTVTVGLQVYHLDAIALTAAIAQNRNSTYLALDSGAVYDMSMVVLDWMQPVSAPMAVSQFVADTTLPLMANFSVDMTNGSITFTFTKPVSAGSFNQSGLKLLSSGGAVAPINVSLTAGSLVSSGNGRVQTVALGLQDLNTIKALVPLFTSAGTSYISLKLASVLDMYGNALASVNATQASAFVSDSRHRALSRLVWI